jgi:cyclopropane fatty-acyl-phospholipid synthase-like methyltransferase
MGMKTYDGYSRESWISGLTPTDDANVRHLLCAFARLGIPRSYLDIGCGTGAMVNAARKLGVDAFGVDQLVDDTWPTYFHHRNLVDYFKLPEPVELVTCVEVAEHIHESAHSTLCDTICDNLAQGGNYLIFCAARPGQGGTGHIACRPAEYWGEQFVLRGLSQNLYLTMNLGLLFSNINTSLNYWHDNLMVWEKT